MMDLLTASLKFSQHVIKSTKTSELISNRTLFCKGVPVQSDQQWNFASIVVAKTSATNWRDGERLLLVIFSCFEVVAKNSVLKWYSYYYVVMTICGTYFPLTPLQNDCLAINSIGPQTIGRLTYFIVVYDRTFKKDNGSLAIFSDLLKWLKLAP